MPTYSVIAEKLNRRTKRMDVTPLGTIDAPDFDTARRLATERWPGRELFVCEKRKHHSQPEPPSPLDRP